MFVFFRLLRFLFLRFIPRLFMLVINFFFLCFSDALPQLLHTSPHSFYPLAPKDASPTALHVP